MWRTRSATCRPSGCCGEVRQARGRRARGSDPLPARRREAPVGTRSGRSRPGKPGDVRLHEGPRVGRPRGRGQRRRARPRSEPAGGRRRRRRDFPGHGTGEGSGQGVQPGARREPGQGRGPARAGAGLRGSRRRFRSREGLRASRETAAVFRRVQSARRPARRPRPLARRRGLVSESDRSRSGQLPRLQQPRRRPRPRVRVRQSHFRVSNGARAAAGRSDRRLEPRADASVDRAAFPKP